MMIRNIKHLYLLLLVFISLFVTSKAQDLPKEFIDPPHEFSVMPFWFWNDTLKDEEIVRQITDFEAHGVYGFVIHPRIGLPEDVTWLGDKMINAMNIAINEASKRKMYVILYDEGMYPSGSSGGQVVARNPAHAARGLAKIDLKKGEEPVLAEGMKLVTIIDRSDGSRVAVVEQPSRGVIRGLHYLNEGEQRLREESPPAGDILNPDAVTSFIDLVYNRYYKEFGKYFGNTIIGIFTDEPSPLGRGSARGVVPGNLSLLTQIQKILGYDFTPFLSDLWYRDNPDSEKHRADYNRAINICLEENYFKRLGNWCFLHNISLMGHPAGSMDIGAERYFQVPGQDLVWRYVEPGPKALVGQHSTMAKCASSAMLHLGYRRNSNEIYGAYGHNLTYDEMTWLAGWCFVRGQNMLIPHAFYYSIRGPRFDERPPDVGPNAYWWKGYKSFADACRRLSWLNTDSHQVCDIAVLCDASFLPDRSAQTLYRNQFDFNYLEPRLLKEESEVNKKGVRINEMNYKVIVLDTISDIPRNIWPLLVKLAKNKHLIVNAESKFASEFKGALIYKTPEDLIAAVNKITEPDLKLTNTSGNIRYRHVIKNFEDYYIIFNEEDTEVNTGFRLQATGNRLWIDPYYAVATRVGVEETITLKPHELKILKVGNAEMKLSK